MVFHKIHLCIFVHHMYLKPLLSEVVTQQNLNSSISGPGQNAVFPLPSELISTCQYPHCKSGVDCSPQESIFKSFFIGSGSCYATHIWLSCFILGN